MSEEELSYNELNQAFLNMSSGEEQDKSEYLVPKSEKKTFTKTEVQLFDREEETPSLFGQKKVTKRDKLQNMDQEIYQQSGIKSKLPNNQLNDSEVKDYNNLCCMIPEDELNKENSEKKFQTPSHRILLRQSHKRVRIIEDSDAEDDKTGSQANYEGKFTNLSVQQSNEKMRMRQYKQLIIRNIEKQSRLDSCPICLTDYLQTGCQSTIVRLTPCEHIMCQPCIIEWAKKYKANCPVCRGLFEEIWPLKWIGELELQVCDQALDFEIDEKQWSMDEDDFYFEEEEDETNDNCQICSRSINFNLMLVCDECNKEVCHTYCDPAIRASRIPEDQWYCMKCRANDKCYSVSFEEMKKIKKLEQKEKQKSKQQVTRNQKKLQENEEFSIKQHTQQQNTRVRANRHRLQIFSSNQYYLRYRDKQN